MSFSWIPLMQRNMDVNTAQDCQQLWMWQQEEEGLCFSLHMQRLLLHIVFPESPETLAWWLGCHVFWSKLTSARRCSMSRRFQNNVLYGGLTGQFNRNRIVSSYYVFKKMSCSALLCTSFVCVWNSYRQQHITPALYWNTMHKHPIN